MKGFQEFGNRCDVLHPGTEPQIVAAGIENHRHPVVDGSGVTELGVVVKIAQVLIHCSEEKNGA